MPSNRSLVFSPDADDDVISILQYTLESWGDAQGRLYAATMDAAFARLIAFPGIGKRRDDLAAGLRSHIVGEHVILYRVTNESLIIRRVVHRHRDLGSLSDL